MPITLLDIAACFRLCLVLRQVREQLRAKHDERVQAAAEIRKVEERSFVREALATLLVIYGGEAITAPYLQQTPSFMLSGAIPILYVVTQGWVEFMQNVPELSMSSELPLALLDGLTRAYLLCNLIPPAVVSHSSPTIANSPWTLLLTSLVTANGGFLLINMFNFLQPYPLTLSTPPEVLPYGWTTTDIWVAPIITALYATLTHAQPYWTGLHYSALGWIGGASVGEDGVGSVEPVDPEIARAVCAVILAGLFSVRTYKIFAVAEKKPAVKAPSEKVKTQ
ncbi:uncharacterized protein PHACADRAFT_257064 [Phanerochaete carnosa HHB-10118-sp]|uniref:Uncharacterized protein n=1 Tax=Phanerochaete carnosa (strain HHB-10118-sp) TaxID=650164 RepID=K5VWV1_PHACS|nr:uncharacterized protein PHACADRAFT_257064 [Phanerochaete carnosa HHB-10118-sp]EKM56038.1 hypothetical protein PHACADRAFT_257064 [Phanerochaete carnosa HHB-10118-sp]